VPTIRLADMTEAQIRAYVIADNRLAELAGWDDELLAIELQALTEIDLDFDIEITGFATAEIDTLIAGLNGKGATTMPTDCRSSTRQRPRSPSPATSGSWAGTACCARMRRRRHRSLA
jgi:hypothetical protein